MQQKTARVQQIIKNSYTGLRTYRWHVLMIRWYASMNTHRRKYIHCVSEKRDPDIIDCNLKID